MTKLIYLENTYKFNIDSIIINFGWLNEKNYIILKETIFHYQGGGQPADTGKIYNNNFIFNVYDVRVDKRGDVLHFCDFIINKGIKNNKVSLLINKNKRILYSKIHSAGHLIDCTVEKLEFKKITPIKGYHFPDSPYVEYNGILIDKEKYLPIINTTFNDLVKKNIKLFNQYLSFNDTEKLNISTLNGMTARVVYFQDFSPCGCGGTHVKSSNEIGSVNIKKLK